MSETIRMEPAMEAKEELISLDNLINALQIILDTLEKQEHENEEPAQLTKIISCCFYYLQVYRDSVESMIQIKRSMEKLHFKNIPAHTKHQ